MPVVMLRMETGAGDRKETLSEYLCDYPDCPHPAEHVLGFAREVGGGFAVCGEHAVALRNRARENSSHP